MGGEADWNHARGGLGWDLVGELLQDKYAATRVAFAAGTTGEDQVRVIVRAAETLPSVVTDAQRAQAEEVLVAKARAGMNPRRLRQAARRMAEKISRELADQHEAEQLRDEEEHAETETWLSLHDNGDGRVLGAVHHPGTTRPPDTARSARR